MKTLLAAVFVALLGFTGLTASAHAEYSFDSNRTTVSGNAAG
jgi:hypothetical protein